MAKLSGADLFVRALKNEGVKYIFTLSGGHVSPIYNSCIDHEIGIIDVRHEQVAAHAAAGWARVTREPGVAVVTAGPGVTNSITGLADAFMAGCPMLEFGGRVPMSEFELGSLQEMDQVRLVEPVTKWAKPIFDAARMPEYVSNAFSKARAGTPGPVYLECPVDVLMSQVDDAGIVFHKGCADQDSGASQAQLTKVLDLLASAQRPVIIAGDGVFWAAAEKDLQEFVELSGIPVRMVGLGRGAVPEDHPLAIARAGTAKADLVLAFGIKFNYSLNFGRPPMFDANARSIQVGVDACSISYNRHADVGIVASPKTVLRQLIDALKGSKKGRHEAWVSELNAAIKASEAQSAQAYSADSLPVHPARLAREVVEFLDRDAIVASDGGDCAGWFSPAFKARHTGQILATGALGCLGVGTGFALAAKLANPGRQVLLYSGDGSFGLHAMEFDTYVRHNLPVVAVISNDGCWGMAKHVQRMAYGADKVQGTMLKAGQRYDKMVEALGGYGEYVERIEDIKPALARAFASGLPACVNVAVDPVPFSLATKALGQGVLLQYM